MASVMLPRNLLLEHARRMRELVEESDRPSTTSSVLSAKGLQRLDEVALEYAFRIGPQIQDRYIGIISTTPCEHVRKSG